MNDQPFALSCQSIRFFRGLQWICALTLLSVLTLRAIWIYSYFHFWKISGHTYDDPLSHFLNEWSRTLLPPITWGILLLVIHDTIHGALLRTVNVNRLRWLAGLSVVSALPSAFSRLSAWMQPGSISSLPLHIFLSGLFTTLLVFPVFWFALSTVLTQAISLKQENALTI